MSQVTPRTPHLETKLPTVGTTIFTVMSALGAEKGAVNLGQGFPDFDCDPKLVQAVTDAMAKGLNQYPPMTGVPVLREAVSAKIERMYGRRYDPAGEITITDGERVAAVANGHALMAKVTAMGCAGSALVTACLAVEPDAFRAAVAALVIIGVAGEMAAEK